MGNSDDFRDFEHKGWQTQATGYKDQWVELTGQATAPLLDAACVDADSTLLDVACGPGHLAGAAVERGASVVGMDFSSEVISLASQSHKGVAFVEGDAENMPFASESFDAVTMSFGVLHLSRPELAFEEIVRVLKPNGRFSMTVWAPPSNALGFKLVLDAVAKHGIQIEVPKAPDFFQYSDPEIVKKAVRSVGFESVVTEQVPMTWHLQRPEDVYRAYVDGTVRTGAVLRAQTDAAREEIAKYMAIKARDFIWKDGSLRIPMNAVMTSAIKPLIS